MEPQIRYATSADGTRIAYAVQAGTPPAILLIWGWPRRLTGRVEVRRAEAWMLTGLAVGGVAMFAVASLLADHRPA